MIDPDLKRSFCVEYDGEYVFLKFYILGGLIGGVGGRIFLYGVYF